jgi:hypothetical protein
MGKGIFSNNMTQPGCQKEKGGKGESHRGKGSKLDAHLVAIKTQSYSFLLSFSRSRAFPLTLKLFPLLARLYQLIHKMGTAY